MVQDILDPEYYDPYDNLGRSKHFGDHRDVNFDDDNIDKSKDSDYLKGSIEKGQDARLVNQMNYYSESLAERIPLVVVPIPFASKWVGRGRQVQDSSRGHSALRSDCNAPKASNSAVVSPVSNLRRERKRGRSDIDNVIEDGDSDMNEVNFKSHQQTTQKQKLSENDKCGKDDGLDVRKGNKISSDLTSTTDLWPAGTFGTSVHDCPVLAKMCYDELLSGDRNSSRDICEDGTEEEQIEVESGDSGAGRGAQRGSGSWNSPRQRPLMLNDLVSFVGVLSVNPWDADFSQQRSSSVLPEGGIDYYEWESMLATTNPIPPPSRLPRIYVLSYRRFDLDDLARRAVNVEKQNYNTKISINGNNMVTEKEEICDPSHSPDADSDSDDESEAEWCGFPTEKMPIPSGIESLLRDDVSEGLLSAEAAPWIRALWLCLLSEADRRQVSTSKEDVITKMVRAGPAERALGCVSLQLSTPDVASAKSLYRDLAEHVLPSVCPVVAAIDLTEIMVGTSDESFIPGRDNNGRMIPCPLQLPKGSVLLINYPRSYVGMRNNGTHDVQFKNDSEKGNFDKLESIQTVLHELLQHHRISYRFEGGVMIPFDADYRVIIVTTQTQNVPCTLSALTTASSSTATPVEESSNTRTCPTKPDLRQILISGRSLSSNNNFLKFSSIVLERAQRDFLERRRRCHNSSKSTPLPGEDDFHRWLTLTKLQTKDRFCRNEHSISTNSIVLVEETGRGMDQPISAEYLEPSVEDWEAALKVDDTLRCLV